jgi:hypothetical protein
LDGVPPSRITDPHHTGTRLFPMPHYYFHIKAGSELINDEEGSEHATLDHARSQALKTARELWPDAIKSGKSLEAHAIVIADEQG